MAAQTVDVPKRLPLVISPQNRGQNTDKDAKLVNGFMEISRGDNGETETWIYDRPGTLTASQPSGGAAVGRGVYNWKGNIFSIFADKLYKDGVAISGTVDTTGGVYQFSSCLGATPKLQLGNGVKAYNYDAGAGLVEITDFDFPSAFVKGWAFLDGTTYVMRPDAGIQGDDINTPTDWDPLNVIIAQIEPDFGVALSKQLVYVIAMKQWSVEVFYDAGNATGSPLGQVQGAKVSYGCISADSVQDIDGALFFLSTSRTAGNQVLMIDQLKSETISTPEVERLLQGKDFSQVSSWQVSVDGHRFYVATIKLANLSIVYDLDQRRWSQWTDADGNYSKICASTYDSSGRAILQHESNGKLYYCNTIYQNDDGTPFHLDIITPNFDAGVGSRGKQMNMLKFVADQQPGQIIQVRVSDDDYQTWSEPRYVDFGQKMPYLDSCGTFQKRAHWFRKYDSLPFRLRAIEPQIDLCTL